VAVLFPFTLNYQLGRALCLVAESASPPVLADTFSGGPFALSRRLCLLPRKQGGRCLATCFAAVCCAPYGPLALLPTNFW
jgi:hypothetical protein